jgi:hypothetical protein
LNQDKEEIKISPKFYDDQRIQNQERIDDEVVVFSWTDKLEGLALPKQTLKAVRKQLEIS